MGDRKISCASNGSSVKIAGLWKRSQGLRKFTKPNWRHRVFILTEQVFSYYSGTLDRIGALKGRIPIDTIKAIEHVDHVALGLAHTLQVIYQTKKHGYVTLYITASDQDECNDWIASIRQACYFNNDMLMHYHPGAFAKTGWSCCRQRLRPTLGCQPTYYLLTRSSSRYAENMRRNHQAAARHVYHHSSSASCKSSRACDRVKSTSCDNLHLVNPLLQMKGVPSYPVALSQSNVALNEQLADNHMTIVADHMTNTKDHVTDMVENSISSQANSQDTLTQSMEEDNEEEEEDNDNGFITISNVTLPRTGKEYRALSCPIQRKTKGCTYQIAPFTSSVVVHKHRRLSSVDSGNETTPPPKQLYIGGSRGSSLSTEECDYVWPPRKASIEPRISATNPELIHV